MKMIELTKEQFENFAYKSPYKNYCQTDNYGQSMRTLGFDYNYVAYTTNDDEILAAAMFLTKKIGKKYYYAYSPKGYLVDYEDKDLLRRFTNNLVKYYKRKNIIFMKINPELAIAKIDYKNNYQRIILPNAKIVDDLKRFGFKRRKESTPLELIEPKLTAIVNLKDYDINKLDYVIKDTNNKGLEIEIAEQNKIDNFYEFIKDKTNYNIDFYRNLLNQFKKDNKADLMLVKVNYEKCLIGVKKRIEEEEIRNNELNEKLQKDSSEIVLIEKMNSDKLLEEYKQDIINATNGLKNNNGTYIAGAIVIKHENKITILVSGINNEYETLKPEHFLYNKIFEMYKDDYEIADLNGIANDFSEFSPYYELNKFKMSFNPNIIEYVGELDMIINNWKFKLVEKNHLLSNEFNIKKSK